MEKIKACRNKGNTLPLAKFVPGFSSFAMGVPPIAFPLA
jgi:hypothetical protein